MMFSSPSLGGPKEVKLKLNDHYFQHIPKEACTCDCRSPYDITYNDHHRRECAVNTGIFLIKSKNSNIGFKNLKQMLELHFSDVNSKEGLKQMAGTPKGKIAMSIASPLNLGLWGSQQALISTNLNLIHPLQILQNPNHDKSNDYFQCHAFNIFTEFQPYEKDSSLIEMKFYACSQLDNMEYREFYTLLKKYVNQRQLDVKNGIYTNLQNAFMEKDGLHPFGAKQKMLEIAKISSLFIDIIIQDFETQLNDWAIKYLAPIG